MQANWVAYNNVTHGPTEKQLYLAKNVRVENGNLVIQTIKDAVHDSDGILYNFSSGWVRQSVVNTQYTWGKQVYTFKIDRSESYRRCGRRIASATPTLSCLSSPTPFIYLYLPLLMLT